MAHKSLKRIWFIAAVLVIAAVCVWLAIRIVNAIDYRNNDFFTFWLAGHMAATGGNPYAPDQWVAGHHEFGVSWIPNQAFVYPLPLSLLFVPLGLIPLYTAFIVWVAISMLMVLAALFFLLKKLSSPGLAALLIFVGVIFFRPTILTLFHGQLSGLLVLLLVIGAYLWEKGAWGWGSLALVLLVLKPNLGVPLIGLQGIWLLRQRRFKTILIIAGFLLALLIIGLIQNPHWLTDYWSIGSLKMTQNFGGSPTIWGASALVCGGSRNCMLALGGPALGLLFVLFIWLVWFRHPDLKPLQSASLAGLITLLATPYIWTYDQLLLLLPIVMISLGPGLIGFNPLTKAGLFLAIDIFAFIPLYFDNLMHLEIYNVIIPLLILILFVWQLNWEHRIEVIHRPVS